MTKKWTPYELFPPVRYARRTKDSYEVGMLVGWARAFLKDTFAAGTDPRWSVRGTVVALHPTADLVQVSWEGDPQWVNPNNIAREGTAAWAD